MRARIRIVSVVLAVCGAVVADSGDERENVLFREGFDDARLVERGWYDGERFEIVREGAYSGGGCIEYRWKPDTTSPASSSGIRHLFEPTDTVYVRFFIRLSKGWGWTGRPYHPHLMHFMTTENGRYHGPAASHLTLYIEPQEGRLRLAARPRRWPVREREAMPSRLSRDSGPSTPAAGSTGSRPIGCRRCAARRTTTRRTRHDSREREQ